MSICKLSRCRISHEKSLSNLLKFTVQITFYNIIFIKKQKVEQKNCFYFKILIKEIHISVQKVQKQDMFLKNRDDLSQPTATFFKLVLCDGKIELIYFIPLHHPKPQAKILDR